MSKICAQCQTTISDSVLRNNNYKIIFAKFQDLYEKISEATFPDVVYCRICINAAIPDLEYELSTRTSSTSNMQTNVLVEKIDGLEPGSNKLVGFNYVPTSPPDNDTSHTALQFGSRWLANPNYKGLRASDFSPGQVSGKCLLDPQSEEYKQVSMRFCNPDKILFIEQNKSDKLIQEHFNAIKDLQTQGKKYITINLWHGSNNDNYDNITTDGFSLKHAKGGTMGNGVYGAMRSTYSEGFAYSLSTKISPQIAELIDNPKFMEHVKKQKKTKEGNTDDHAVLNIKIMLLCDFVLAQNHQTIKYDSGDIFCVYNDRHVYPKYLVYFYT